MRDREQEHRSELTLRDRGAYLVTTATSSVYRIDLSEATVERVDGYPRVVETPSDSRHSLRTLNRVRVGERGQWILHHNGDDADDGLLWYITSRIISIIAVDAPPAVRDSTWHLLGPVHTDASLCARLGLSQSELDQLVQTDQILRVVTADGTDLYPAFQFGDDDSLLPALAEVIAELAAGTSDAWTWWQYLVTPAAKRHGKTVWEILRDNRLNDAIRDAGQTAWAWKE